MHKLNKAHFAKRGQRQNRKNESHFDVSNDHQLVALTAPGCYMRERAAGCP